MASHILVRPLKNVIGSNLRLVRFKKTRIYQDPPQKNDRFLIKPNAKGLTAKDFYVSKEEIAYKEALHGTITVAAKEDVGLVSGVPEEHIKTRRVRIYQPAKSAMQSGTNNIQFWQIDFDTRERWENPLMGWTSTGDPLSNVKVDFTSADEAIEHCQKMGWEYYIQAPNNDNPKTRSYGQNFAWNKRTRVSTK